MANTGYKGYTTLEQYYTDDGLATGVTKSNVNSDPDYVLPVFDTDSCPIGNTFIYVSPETYNAEHYGETIYIYVDSNYTNLSFYPTESWVNITVDGSDGNFTLTVTIDLNYTHSYRYSYVNVIHNDVDVIASTYITQGYN